VNMQKLSGLKAEKSFYTYFSLESVNFLQKIKVLDEEFTSIVYSADLLMFWALK